MKSACLAAAAMALLSVAHAQEPARKPVFEVASVRKSPPQDGPMRLNFGARQGDRWRAQNAPLRALLRTAYAVEFPMEGQIVGGPSWITTVVGSR